MSFVHAAGAFRKELSKHITVDPYTAAGRALGLPGPLTLEALVCDPDLGGLPASNPQLALIRAADGKPVNDVLPADRMLFHFGREALPSNDNGLLWDGRRLPSGRPRLVVLRTGVRAGKTLIAVLALLLSVLTCRFRRPPTEDEIARGVKPAADGMIGVRPGELVRAVIVAPRLELTRAPFAHLVNTMKGSAKLRALFAEDPKKESCIIRRPDGNLVEVKCLAADAGGANLRSTWLAGALFDEADFHDDDDAAVNLTENLRACAARMLTDSQIWIPSSPWAEGSAFDKLFHEIQKDQLRDGRLAFHSDTLSMNPAANLAEIEAMRRTDPDNAAREYDAIPFGAGAELFYPEDAIRASFTHSEFHVASADGKQIEVLAPDPRCPHVAAADWGFRKNSSAIAITRSDGGKVRLAFRVEYRPQKGESLKPSRVVQEFAFWAMKYGCPAILGDMHSVDSTIEELNKLARALKEPEKADAEQKAWVERVKGDPFARTAQVPRYIEWPSKTTAHPDNDAAHTEMKRRMQEGLVELPADDRMKQQCRDTKRRPAPGGHMKILLPKHGMAHGDLWGATVIACVEIGLAPVRPARERPRRESDSRYSGDAPPEGRGYG